MTDVRFMEYGKAHRPAVDRMIEDAFVREDMAGCMDSFPQYATLALLGCEIVGVSAFTGEGARRSFTLYVHPAYRERGIGTQLIAETERRMRGAGTEEATCDFLDKEPENTFAGHRGYQRWFDSNYMRYTGQRREAPAADIAAYQDADYDACQRLVSRAFHEMRLLVGMDSALEKPSEAQRMHYRNNAGNTFLLRAAGEIVAVLKLDGDEIDSLAVRNDMQGRGYGKLMLAYGINTLLDRGAKDITLWVVEGNPAKRLYQGMGFGVMRLHRFVKRCLK